MKKLTAFLLVALLAFLLFALQGAKADGEEYWAKTYGGESYDGPWAIVIAPNGDVVIAGYTENFGAGDGDAWILRLDKNGTVKWQKTYGGSRWDEVEALTLAPNGDIIAAGRTDSFSAWNALAWILRLDSNGNVEWQRWYGRQEAEDYAVEDIEAATVAPDGDIIAVGYTRALTKGGVGDVWVARLDPQGNIEWQRIYGGQNDEVGWAVAVTPNGDIIVVGGTASFGAGYWDFWVLCLDPDGNVKWGKAYGKEGFDEAHSIAIAPDGGIIVGGTSEREGGFNDATILKLDGNGNIKWTKAFGIENYDNDATSLVLTEKGDILVPGNYLFLLSSDGKLKWARGGYWNFACDPCMIAWTGVRISIEGIVALVAPGTDGFLVARFDVESASKYSEKEGWYRARLQVSDPRLRVTPASGYTAGGRAEVGETDCEVHDTSVELETRWQVSTASPD